MLVICQLHCQYALMFCCNHLPKPAACLFAFFGFGDSCLGPREKRERRWRTAIQPSTLSFMRMLIAFDFYRLFCGNLSRYQSQWIDWWVELIVTPPVDFIQGAWRAEEDQGENKVPLDSDPACIVPILGAQGMQLAVQIGQIMLPAVPSVTGNHSMRPFTLRCRQPPWIPDFHSLLTIPKWNGYKLEPPHTSNPWIGFAWGSYSWIPNLVVYEVHLQEHDNFTNSSRSTSCFCRFWRWKSQSLQRKWRLLHRRNHRRCSFSLAAAAIMQARSRPRFCLFYPVPRSLAWPTATCNVLSSGNYIGLRSCYGRWSLLFSFGCFRVESAETPTSIVFSSLSRLSRILGLPQRTYPPSIPSCRPFCVSISFSGAHLLPALWFWLFESALWRTLMVKLSKMVARNSRPSLKLLGPLGLPMVNFHCRSSTWGHFIFGKPYWYLCP